MTPTPQQSSAELLSHVRAWASSQLGSEPTSVIVELADGSRITLRGRDRTLDYRSVTWDGARYYFSEPQAAIVKLLWEAIPKGGDVGKRALIAAAETAGGDVGDIFKTHEAWQVLILGGRTKGTWRLAD